MHEAVRKQNEQICLFHELATCYIYNLPIGVGGLTLVDIVLCIMRVACRSRQSVGAYLARHACHVHNFRT